jgi:hypothetical protein
MLRQLREADVLTITKWSIGRRQQYHDKSSN